MIRRVIERLDRGMEPLLGVVAGVLLFCMMSVTFVDVVLRYIFNAPLRGSFEVTELMLVVLIFAALPLVSRREEHVVMDFLDRHIGPRLYRFLRALEHVVSAAVMGGIGWLLWQRASKLAAYGDTTSVLRIQLAPFVYAIAVLIFVTALIHLGLVFARRGGPNGGGPEKGAA
ncbi:MAG: TRAP transporter small permease [Proteobacteria bacterium]|nr:TRAP transporter small permease [Pseudomonadota bacterium]